MVFTKTKLCSSVNDSVFESFASENKPRAVKVWAWVSNLTPLLLWSSLLSLFIRQKMWEFPRVLSFILGLFCFLRENSLSTSDKRCQRYNERSSLWFDWSHKGSSIWLVYAGNELLGLIRDLRFDLSKQVKWSLLFTCVMWSFAK